LTPKEDRDLFPKWYRVEYRICQNFSNLTKLFLGGAIRLFWWQLLVVPRTPAARLHDSRSPNHSPLDRRLCNVFTREAGLSFQPFYDMFFKW
jgi:hypothetical protein